MRTMFINILKCFMDVDQSSIHFQIEKKMAKKAKYFKRYKLLK